MSSFDLVCSDAGGGLAEMADESARMIFTSPPYWNQRDYGVEGQLGLEATVAEYVAALVEVFREARRVLVQDGLVFLNVGDGYSSRSRRSYPTSAAFEHGHQEHRELERVVGMQAPHKSLLGVPWATALALREDGWVIRSAVTWHKIGARPHPGAVDRPQNDAEYVFVLARSERYLYSPSAHPLGGSSVWPIRVVQGGEHPAAFPPELPEVGVLCSSAPGEVVLDPFCGSGSTGVAALRHGRAFVGIDLNPDYLAVARERLVGVTPTLLDSFA